MQNRMQEGMNKQGQEIKELKEDKLIKTRQLEQQDQKISSQDQRLSSQDQRISKLEKTLSEILKKIATIADFSIKLHDELTLTKDESIKIIDQFINSNLKLLKATEEKNGGLIIEYQNTILRNEEYISK